MKKIAIICALSSELQLIKEEMQNISTVSFKGNEFFCGELFGNKLFCAIASIGKVNAAVKTQMIIDKFDVDLVINTGVAGSLDATAKHLSVVVGNKLHYHDFDLSQYLMNAPFQAFFKSDKTLVDLFLEANSTESDIVVGDIATGDEFVNDVKKKNEIATRLNAIACEMEGAAISHTAFLNSLPCIVIRCISDLADDDVKGTFNEFVVVASHKVAKMVIKFIALIK